MLRNDEHFESTVELFRHAALGQAPWDDAMAGLAGACHGVSCNLVGVGDGRLQFFWANDLDPTMWDDLGDVMNSEVLNPRLALGGQARPFHRVEGIDFASDEWVRRFPVYGEVCRKYDLGFGSLMNLKKTERDYLGVGILRNQKQGHGSQADADALSILAPHVADSVKLQRMVEDQGSLLACGALEAVGAAAFLCDAWGRVRNLTPAAELLVGSQGPLILKAGYLGCRSADCDKVLGEAVARASRHQTSRVQTLVLKQEWVDPLVLDVAPLPVFSGPVGFTPRAIVTVRMPRVPRETDVLMRIFGLTHAEADVSTALALGEPREAIAASRGVSLETIRTQLKGIFIKLGVSREAEMIAKIYQVTR